jgi:methyl-accepting chemotaxis protein
MKSIVAEIATAGNEQSRTIEQINTAVSERDTVTQADVGSSEETARASENSVHRPLD